MGITRRVGVALIALGVVLALAVIPLWSNATDDAERKTLANDYAEAISGTPFEDVEPDRTVPIAVGVVGAVVFLAGVILVAVPRPSDGS